LLCMVIPAFNYLHSTASALERFLLSSVTLD
jgi:hypothetical protein